MKPLPKLLDCTLRDGGYINNWDFDLKFATALTRAASKSGCDYVEVGFFDPDAEGRSPWMHLTPETLNSLKSVNGPNAKTAVMINYGAVKLNQIPNADEYPVDMIRVATHKSARHDATKFAADLSAKGYETTVNYMGVTSYTNSEILSLVDLINTYRNDVAYFYLADSFGSLLPSRTREIFTTLRFGSDAKLGFHPHNNLQLAFANCLEAIEAEVDIIDGSVFGMGRGAGNLFTEAMLAYFEQCEPGRYDLVPILQFADLYMEELKRHYRWGYSLPQLLSGILGCHPNYPTNLLQQKAFTADDIFGMLKNLSVQDRPQYSVEQSCEIRSAHFQNVIEHSIEHIDTDLPQLCKEAKGKALIVCGGPSITDELKSINTFIAREQPAVFAINNPKPPLEIAGVFFGNRRRFLRKEALVQPRMHVILGLEMGAMDAGSDSHGKISRVNALACLNKHESPFRFRVPENSATEGILALVRCGFKEIYVCGLDGYRVGKNYYYAETDQIEDTGEMERENQVIQEEINLLRGLQGLLDFRLEFITKSHIFS